MMSRKKYQLLCSAAVAAIALFVGTDIPRALLAVAAERHNVVAALEPIIPQLRVSKTPVYLPTWIPSWNYKLYSSAGLGDFEYPAGYEVTLTATPDSPCNANTLFYLSAGKGSPHKISGSSKVDLGGGRFGYYYGGGNFHTLDWAIGKHSYHLAVYKPQAELIKIAKSMVYASESAR